MRAVLIDDEYYARQGLKMILDEIGGIEIVGMYEDGLTALQGIEALNPDLIFLDIEMPGMNGLELCWKIEDIQENPNIIFVTAYSQYAVEAFELKAFDYILKPVQKARLLKTLDRIVPLIGKTSSSKGITINCFGHLSVQINGQEINTGWRTKKAEELLAYLICSKGRFISKEKIASNLWPELDGAKSVSNLYLAYHYLKKQENNHGELFLIESVRGKMRIRLDEIACDMVTFEDLLQKCSNIDDDNIHLAEKAAELYKGMLFEDSYYSWVTEAQQYYELSCLKLLQQMEDFFRRKGDQKKQSVYKEIISSKF